MFLEDGITGRRSSGCRIVVKGYCSRAVGCSWFTCDGVFSSKSACEDMAHLGLRFPGAPSPCGNWVPTNSSLLGLAVGLSVLRALKAVMCRRLESGELNSSWLVAGANKEWNLLLILLLLLCRRVPSFSSCLEFNMCSL